MANGTDALELALRAAEVPAGAEVIMPANTFVATAEAVVRHCSPQAFADVDPDYLLLDPGGLEAALNQQTGAVIPVHLFGQMTPMAAIADVTAQRGTVIIEDAAQAHGATPDHHRQLSSACWPE